MDLIRLGTVDGKAYLPDMMLEGFTSKIWTERFFDPGEFQLKTPYVDKFLDLLPEKSFISHRQTRETMQVENTLVGKDGNGNWELSITGRSCDYILEHRYVEGSYKKRRQMARQYAPNGAALCLIWNSIDNASGYDVTRRRQDDNDENNNDPDHDGPRWPWNDKDILPDVAVSDSVIGNVGDQTVWWVTEGMALPQIQKMLRRGDLGLRTIRPPTTATGLSERVWIHSGLSDLGDIERVDEGTFHTLRFDVYNGVNRTIDQTDNNRVVFNTLRKHLKNEQYLVSVKEWKTGVEVMSGLNRKKDVFRPGQSGWSGWDRRIMAYDAGEPEIAPEPERPKRKNFGSDSAFNEAVDKWETKHDNWKARKTREINQFENDYEKDALRELNKFRRVSLFSGDVTPEAPYVYKVNYDLGDIVTLRGAYGEKENMIIAEYVRTEDAEGDRGYPGLTVA